MAERGHIGPALSGRLAADLLVMRSCEMLTFFDGKNFREILQNENRCENIDGFKKKAIFENNFRIRVKSTNEETSCRKCEFGAVQMGDNIVDLENCFKTRTSLLTSASLQPRASPVEFARCPYPDPSRTQSFPRTRSEKALTRERV